MVLARHETKWASNIKSLRNEKFNHNGQSFMDYVAWHRYVDDVIIMSKCFCAPCLLSAVHQAYPVSLSVSSGWWGMDTPHIVADVQIVPNENSFDIIHKNEYREFLLNGGERKNTSLLPYLGTLPMSFAILRGQIIGLHKRCLSLGMDSYFTACRIIEFLWELHVLGYPNMTIVNLAHCLPASDSAKTTRSVIRAGNQHHLTSAMVWPRGGGKGGNNNFTNNYGGKGYRRDDSRDRDDRGYSGNRRYDRRDDRRYDRYSKRDRSREGRSHRRRRSHTSSDSSDELREEKKVSRAKKLLENKDSQYKTYLTSETKRVETEKVIEQGKAMAAAIGPALAASIGKNQPTQPSTAGTQAPSLKKSDPPDVADAATEPELNPRMRWLSAELAHVKFTAKSWKTLHKQIVDAQAKAKISKLTTDFLVRYGKHDADIKLKIEEKAAKVIDILQNN